MKRPDVGRRTLAACETCGRYVDIPLQVDDVQVVEDDHRLDHHPAYPGTFRLLTRVLDPQGTWDRIITTTRPTPPGRRLK